MEQKERLKKVINWLVYKEITEGQNALAEQLGYSKSYMSQALNGHENLSSRFIKRICSLDPNLNIDWVLKEEGDMFIQNPFTNIPLSPQASINDSSSQQIVVSGDIMNILKAQAQSLATKDRQMDEIIALLREEILELKKNNVQKDVHAICADAG